jgi:GTPase SAR1 family protein
LLLLGTGESGKSTVFKQMKIIQDNGGFAKEELLDYGQIVKGNCVTQMKSILNAMVKKLNIPLKNKELEEVFKRVLNSDGNWTDPLGQDVKLLWGDEGVKEAFKFRDTHFQLDDGIDYFFDRIDILTQPGFMPSQEEVLRIRVRSTGIEEAEFKFKDIKFRMVDVGGQRSERRKWIHCFDSVNAIIFCVALSEYDQVLREDDTQNRMKESLLLFQEIVNSHWFRNTTFIIFFNKMDLFKQKIKEKPLTDCFPNYTGGPDWELATQFIKARFLEVRQQLQTQQVFTHFTCAIDTENIQLIFMDIKETILKKILNEMILY